MTGSDLLQLGLRFAGLSLLMVGGATSVLPEAQRQLVDTLGWMSAQDFTEAFALAQIAPGPNVMVFGLIGLYVAGAPGFFVGLFAVLAPSCGLASIFANFLGSKKKNKWVRRLKDASTPLAVGLTLASGLLLVRFEQSWLTPLVAAGAAAFATFSNKSPIYAIFIGAAAFVGINRIGFM